jgi:hypothetical protein
MLRLFVAQTPLAKKKYLHKRYACFPLTILLFADVNLFSFVYKIKHCVDSSMFAKYEEFSLTSALTSMPDVRFCPKANCKNAMVLYLPYQLEKNGLSLISI